MVLHYCTCTYIAKREVWKEHLVVKPNTSHFEPSLKPLVAVNHKPFDHISPPSLPPPQEVDGESLLSMDPEMMVKLMGVKAGPALRIHKRVIALTEEKLPSWTPSTL